VATSVAVHGLAFLLLFALRFSTNVPSIPVPEEHFTLLAPVVRTPVLPRKVQVPRPEYHPIPQVRAHLELPPVFMIPAPAVEISKPALPEIHASPVAAMAIPLVRKESGFQELKAAAPAPAPKPVVRASGFQSTESSVTGAAHGTLVAVGSFNTASGAEGAPVRNAVSRAGGFSDASASTPRAASHGSITSGAFGDTTVEKSARQTALPRASGAALTPVEILSKPKPAYTEEARAKKIEGEVLLEMQFSASGEARVVRVVRGLGHGLDETALAGC